MKSEYVNTILWKQGFIRFVDLSGYNHYEIKAVVQHRKKTYQDSAEDIVTEDIGNNIIIKNKKNKVGAELPEYIIDLQDVPNFLKQEIAQNIHNQLQ